MGVRFKILTLLVFVVSIGFAQSDVDSTTVVDGVTYEVYQVKSGETLYGLSRKKKVSVDQIKKANNGLTEGLKSGGYIFLPYDTSKSKKSRVESKVVTKQPQSKSHDEIKGNNVYHTVEKGETIYGISTDYGVTEEKLKEWNPELENGLTAGMIIKIVLKDNIKEDGLELLREYYGVDTTDTVVQSFVKKIDPKDILDSNYINIGVFLPFQYALIDSLEKNKKEYEDFKLPKDIEVFIEFYEGVKIALDSLQKQGHKIRAFVYDTKADSNVVKNILKKPEVAQFNMIIGPVYSKTTVPVARFCAENGVYMVSPFSKNYELIKDNNFVIKVRPTSESHIKKVTEYAYEKYPNENIILVSDGTKSNSLISVAQSKMVEIALSKDSLTVSIPDAVVGLNGIKTKLIKSKVNVLIIPTKSERFVTKLLAGLHSLTTDYKFVVIGLEQWKKFSNLDIAYWNSLDVHLTKTFLPNYADSATHKFINSYYNSFYTEPTKYAFLGFDIAYLLVPAMKEKELSILNMELRGAISDYKFVRRNYFSGIENRSVRIVVFTDYQFVSVDE